MPHCVAVSFGFRAAGLQCSFVKDLARLDKSVLSVALHIRPKLDV